MKITRILARELDAPLQARWRAITAADHAYASPYFSVEYTLAVAEVRKDAYVGVLEDAQGVQGFFPYQLKTGRIGGPMGGQLSDWHGVIATPQAHWEASALMKACSLDIWDFDHLPAAQHPFDAHVSGHGVSPVLDLSGGYEAYLAQRKAAGAQRVAQFLRKARKFEREVGPLRFEPDSRDPRAFAQVVQWKREQCQRTGVPDYFAWGWTTAMVERIAQVQSPQFAGRLSVLWHGDQILGAHFGMRSDRVWHWWFPTYNKGFSDYSPGGILLLEVARAAAAEGSSLLDLGRGDDVYKQSFATGTLALTEGSVMLPSWSRTLRQTRRAVSRCVKENPGLQRAWSAMRPWRDRWTQRRATAPAR